MEKLRSALFVDFDNVYVTGQQAGKLFATHVSTWLGKLSEERAFITKSVYINPQHFAQYIPHFEQEGFTVIKCLSNTHQGKNSTDIQLVVDAMALSYANTDIQEYIVLSADADFIPLYKHMKSKGKTISVGSTTRAMSKSVFQFADTYYFLPDLLKGAKDNLKLTPSITNKLKKAIIAEVKKRFEKKSVVYLGNLYSQNTLCGVEVPPNKWGVKQLDQLIEVLDIKELAYKPHVFYDKTMVSISGEYPAYKITPLRKPSKVLTGVALAAIKDELKKAPYVHFSKVRTNKAFKNVLIPKHLFGYDSTQSLLCAMEFDKFECYEACFFPRGEYYLKGIYPKLEVKPVKRFDSARAYELVRVCAQFVDKLSRPVHLNTLALHPAIKDAHVRFGVNNPQALLANLPWGNYQFANNFVFNTETHAHSDISNYPVSINKQLAPTRLKAAKKFDSTRVDSVFAKCLSILDVTVTNAHIVFKLLQWMSQGMQKQLKVPQQLVEYVVVKGSDAGCYFLEAHVTKIIKVILPEGYQGTGEETVNTLAKRFCIRLYNEVSDKVTISLSDKLHIGRWLRSIQQLET